MKKPVVSPAKVDIPPLFEPEDDVISFGDVSDTEAPPKVAASFGRFSPRQATTEVWAGYEYPADPRDIARRNGDTTQRGSDDITMDSSDTSATIPAASDSGDKQSGHELEVSQAPVDGSTVQGSCFYCKGTHLNNECFAKFFPEIGVSDLF